MLSRFFSKKIKEVVVDRSLLNADIARYVRIEQGVAKREQEKKNPTAKKEFKEEFVSNKKFQR
jgi:hypothetical protein